MTNPNEGEYLIDRLIDILAVPQDRWPAVMSDVRAWLEMQVKLQPLVDDGTMKISPSMRWFDDDITGCTSARIVSVPDIGDCND